MSGNSDDGGTRYLSHDGMAFFGAITASVSHELNNVISIVDQTAGLLRDMIAAEARGTPLSIERLADAANSIQRQTERGLEIIRRLNRFAHSADDPLAEFDVQEGLVNLVQLCQRLADMKLVRLTLASPQEPLRLVGSSCYLQAAVFMALRAALESVQRNDTIQVSARAEGDHVFVRVDCPRPIERRHKDMEKLQSVSARINAKATATSGERGTLVEIAFSRHGDWRV